MKRACLHCGESFLVGKRNPDQHYCSASACQRKRKREWQRHKLHSDTSYKENQRDAQKHWRSTHPEYWKTYRLNHPRYTAGNRHRQHDRNTRNRGQLNRPAVIAKMDAKRAFPEEISGRYQLIPAGRTVANMDVILVQLTVIK